MNNKRPLAPGFVNQLDQKLLINKPSTWSTRIHLVAYYTLAFILLMFLLGFAIPSDPREEGSLGSWITLVSIISSLGLIIWIIYLLRFNVFKRFGKQGRFNGLQTFLLYFLCAGLFVAIPFVPSMIEAIKAHQKYRYDEIASDINNINLKLLRIERDSLDLNWERSTLVYDPNRSIPDELEYSETGGRISATNDTARFYSEIANADSVKKINDTAYILYKCPEFVFANNWQLDDNSKVQLLSSVDLFHQVLENYKAPTDRKALEKELQGLIDKYRIRYVSNYLYNDYQTEDRRARVYSRRDISTLNACVSNVVDKMNRWNESNQKDFLMIFYYITLSITLLLFAFRHSTARTFFLTLLAGTLILILTGLFFSMVSFGSEIVPLIVVLLYFGLFAAVAFSIVSSKVRTAFQGISLNLMLALTPFIPVTITGLVYAAIREYYTEEHDYYSRYQELTRHRELHFSLSQVVGFVLLLILIEPVFKRLYRKWFALGEE
jgi:hypothetical protein